MLVQHDGYTVDYIIKTLCDLSNRKDLYFETKKKFKNKNLTGEIKHQFMNFNKLKNTLDGSQYIK